MKTRTYKTAALGLTLLTAAFFSGFGQASARIPVPHLSLINAGSVSAVKPLRITTSGLKPAWVDEPYDQRFSATGGHGSYKWSIKLDSPLKGLTFEDIGRLSGTPIYDEFAPSMIEVTVTDQDGNKATAKFYNPIGLE